MLYGRRYHPTVSTEDINCQVASFNKCLYNPALAVGLLGKKPNYGVQIFKASDTNSAG